MWQARELGARRADAVLARRRDLAPEVDGVGKVGDLGAVAGAGERRPRLDGAEERNLVEAAEAAGVGERAVAQQAQVVAAALHHRHPQVAAERGCQQRDVLVEELLLQVFRTRRDHDAAAQFDCRQQVRKRLAGAGARFGQQHAAVTQCRADALGEFLLRRPVLVAGEDRSQQAAAAEEPLRRYPRRRLVLVLLLLRRVRLQQPRKPPGARRTAESARTAYAPRRAPPRARCRCRPTAVPATSTGRPASSPPAACRGW